MYVLSHGTSSPEAYLRDNAKRSKMREVNKETISPPSNIEVQSILPSSETRNKGANSTDIAHEKGANPARGGEGEDARLAEKLKLQNDR